jgi:integrase/recombinase XerD
VKYDIHKLKTVKLPAVLQDYLNYMLIIQGNSHTTVDAYKVDIIMFLRYLKLYKYYVSPDSEFETIDISDIDVTFMERISLQDLHSFLAFTENYRNNGCTTRARKVAAMRSFFKYHANVSKSIPNNPSLNLETPKAAKKQPIYLTLDESKCLLSSVDSRNKCRDICIITLFLNTGIRLSELCNIKIDRIKNDTLVILGKNNKERTIYLNECSINAINEYIKDKEKIKDYIIDKDYLFISERKKKINKRTVQRVVECAIEEAGLDASKYTPHKLRHTAATLLYKYGNVDIRSIQQILGHENISTTTIYTHVDDESLRQAIKSNPLNRDYKS